MANKEIICLMWNNPKYAKMGVIGAKSMGVHIVGMYFLDASISEIMELLSLLEKNLTGKVFASYAVIHPESANIPSDVLRAIPVESITNSVTGPKPEDLWEQVSGAIGAVIGVAVKKYVIPNLGFLKGLWDGSQNALANGLKSLMDTLKNLGLSGVDIAAEIVNTIAFSAGLMILVMKKAVYGAKTICGIVFGTLSIFAGLDQRDIWIGVSGVLMGFVSLILGVWSTMDVVKTTLEIVLFIVNIIGGMNGLMLSTVGLIA